MDVSWERLWHIPPAPFHPDLIGFADEAIRETCGTSHRLPSGPLHDAAEMAMAGVPTVMMFVQSLNGISHNKIEDTPSEHLELAVRASTGSPRRRCAGSPAPQGAADMDHRSTHARKEYEQGALDESTVAARSGPRSSRPGTTRPWRPACPSPRR